MLPDLADPIGDGAALDWLVLAALAIALLALLTAVATNRRLRRATPASVRAARADNPLADQPCADAIRHVAVVRYDAFADMGGRMSWSVALLDAAGDGVVLSAIHGRSEARSYAKGVKAGKGEHPLSPEEQQAIRFAMRASRPHAPAATATATAAAAARQG